MGGGEAKRFEELLAWCDRVLGVRPITTGRTRAKVRKNLLFSLFLLLDDLRVAGVPVERELKKVHDGFSSLGQWKEQEPQGRVVSGATISRHYGWFVREHFADVHFTGLDPKRLFDEEEKKQIRERANDKCAVCQDVVLIEAEFDHIKPWIQGGRTIVENGRLVHRECHERGGRFLGQTL